jgi:hypothetical protein
MALLNRQELRQKAQRKFGSFAKSESSKVLNESTRTFSATKTYDIFLSHSYLDADEIEALKEVFEDHKFSVYVDWIEDKQLRRDNVTIDTAKTIKQRLRSCKTLVYAFSINSPNSKWMPWELGFFDGYNGKVSVLPLTDTPTGQESYKGVEFVGIYPYITKTKNLAQNETLYVNEADDIYVEYLKWLKGENPTKRT